MDRHRPISERRRVFGFFLFFFNDTATTEIYTLSLHDALPISYCRGFEVGLEWNWRESGPCNVLIARRLSVDYTQLRSSISEKRPSSCDIRAALLRCIVCSDDDAVLVHAELLVPVWCSGKPERATQHVQELRHHRCIQCIAIARRECHNCSVVFRRLRILTGYSQPITAALSARCKGPIHANSTPIPLQTHGNR